MKLLVYLTFLICCVLFLFTTAMSQYKNSEKQIDYMQSRFVYKTPEFTRIARFGIPEKPSFPRFDRFDIHEDEKEDEDLIASPGGASPMKNRVKGPADLGIYYINSAGLACGGLKTNQCSTSCGALGYPVYWCYPKVCFCHFGNSQEEENNEIIVPTFE